MKPSKKRPRLPPPPRSIAGGGFSLSAGDKRSQRHAKGNWPAFIHIPLPGSAGFPETLEDESVNDAQILTKLAREALVNAKAYLPSVEVQEFFPVASTASWAHLSLAKPFALRKHEVEPFLAALQAAVGQVPSFHISVVREWCFLPGDVKGLDGAEVVLRPERRDLSSRSRHNSGSSSSSKCAVDPYFQDMVIRRGLADGRRRGFLALELATLKENSSSSKGGGGVVPHAGLSRLVAAVDGVMKRFGREPYYDPAHFHVSFAQVDLPTTAQHEKDAPPRTVLSRPAQGASDAAATSGTAPAATESTPEPSPLQFLQDYGSESEEDESAADDAAALHCDNFSVLPVSEICLKTGSQLHHMKLRAC